MPSPFRFGLSVLGMWPFLPLVARAPVYARLLFDLALDERVPASRKALLGLAAAYVASPIDLIPDALPVISRVDDVAVIIVALDLFLEAVPREVLLDRMYALGIDGRELERDLEAVRRYVPRPVRSALMRLPDAIEAGMTLIKGRLAERQEPVHAGRNASQ